MAWEVGCQRICFALQLDSLQFIGRHVNASPGLNILSARVHSSQHKRDSGPNKNIMLKVTNRSVRSEGVGGVGFSPPRGDYGKCQSSVKELSKIQ